MCAHEPNKRPGLVKAGPGRGQGSRGEREREGVSKHLHSRQHPEGDCGVARKTARLHRSQVFCFTENQGDFRIQLHGIGECNPKNWMITRLEDANSSVALE